MKHPGYWTILLVSALAGLCPAAPEPAIVQRGGDWTINVTFEHPQRIYLPYGARGPRAFWYTIITVTNKTNQDVDFFPKAELMTDTFQIIPASQQVPPIVFENTKQRHLGKYPFLESLEETSSRILQGEDNAKDIAVIWPDFDHKAKTMKLYITGLSNETAAVDHPVAKDANGQPAKVFLRKTLELTYALEGDPNLRSALKVAFKGQRWVMR